MEILITGGAGFIGSHLVHHILNTTNWKVIVLDRLDSTANLDRLDDVRNRIQFVWWDLKAPINLATANRLKGVEMVFHLAASSHVDRSIMDPLDFVLDNTVGTTNLLNWARTNPALDTFVHISTDEIFGTANHTTYSRSDASFPENPYAASKAAAESMVISYACTYQLPCIIVRMTNVIGIKQHPEKYIPLAIKTILEDRTLQIHASGNRKQISSRYYIDIDDICRALMLILFHGDKIRKDAKEMRFRGFYHISGENDWSNLVVAQTIAKCLGKSLKYSLVAHSESRPFFDVRYSISCEELTNLGWNQEVKIEESLYKIVNWYKANREWLIA